MSVRRITFAAILGIWLCLVAACLPVAPETQTSAPAAAPNPTAAAVAAKAVWAPGELSEHFAKHPEGYGSRDAYDRGARQTIERGTRFTYRDTQSNAPRVGYYLEASNRFTALTGDERRITTHFQPDRGAAYVRGLPGSSYR